jgi:hypothetical protein
MKDEDFAKTLIPLFFDGVKELLERGLEPLTTIFLS